MLADIEQLVLGRGQEAVWFTAFADRHGVNAPTVSYFKPPA